MSSTISVKELSQHLTEDGELRVIDIRDGDAYGAGHIPGALHIPFLRLQQKPDLVPDDRSVVIYSGNNEEDQKNCTEAANTLERLNLRAQVLEGGYAVEVE